MDEIAIRLECLRLAANATEGRGSNVTLHIAKEFEAFLLGSGVMAKVDLLTPKEKTDA